MLPKSLPLWGPQCPENSPVDCFQRGRAGRPQWHGKAVTDEVSLP